MVTKIAVVLTLTGCIAAGCAFGFVRNACAAPSQNDQASGMVGDIRHHVAFSSRYLSAKRDLWVYLPPGYESSVARYPVLYMHDGGNLFDPRLATYGQAWEIDNTAERLIRAGELPPLIIVGVGNTADRMDEYNWVRGSYQGKPFGGQGKQYARFLVEELKPFIDKSYRTLPDRAHTGVMGSSLGGLINLYLGRYRGDVFGKIGVVSPSIFWADRAVLEELPQLPTDLRIWLDIGQKETPESDETVADAQAAKRILEKRGYRLGENLAYFEDPDGRHNEQAWARRAPMALKFLFPL